MFDFALSNNPCPSTYNIIFHKWEGVKEEYWHRKTRYTRQKDATNIEKLKNNYFCYKPMTYKELLYNGQIIKNNEECKNDYPKDCGIIDTLKQHLCIKENEKCPLYDIGIGLPPISYKGHFSFSLIHNS